MHRMIRTAFCFLAALAVPPAFSQGFSSIVGTVTDPSGGVIPEATVKATNEGTSLSRAVTTNAQGYFVVTSLPPALYDVEVEAPGFVKYLQKGIRLLADQAATVNIALNVQQQNQAVTVEATPPSVNTTTSTLSQVVEERRITDLPLNGRNAATLALLVPGTIQAPSGSSDQGVYKTFPSAVTISANGSRANQTAFRMDGANNNDTYTNVNQPFPFPDALQEFSVQTSNYSAKYGGNAGAVVNVITKSGSNELHGDAFEFVRNAVFNARNSFASRRDQLKRNQFGGTFGGPVVFPHLYNGRNKTFFFFGYQGTRLRNTNNGLSTFVPTIAERGGDFSALLSASNPNNPFGRAVTIADPLTNKPFANNQIPSSRFDPSAVAFFKYLPAVDGSGLVRYSQPTAQDFNEYLSRVDHSFGGNDRLTARYFLDRFSNAPFLDPTNYVNVLSGSTIDSHNAMLGETHVFRSNIVNEIRAGFSRVESNGGPPPGTVNVNDLGVNLYQPNMPKSLDGLSLSGYFSLSDFPPSLFVRNNYTLGDDISWVHGRHNIAFGVDVERGQVMIRNGFQAYGAFTFTPDYTNDAAASFLLGKIRTFRQGSGEFKDNRNAYIGLYVQDDFHATRKLTLNLGLRYEPFLPWKEIRGRVEQFRPQDYTAGNRSRIFTNAPPGLFFPGDAGVPKYGVDPTYTNFSPRVGFAYDVFGDGRMSIRGGGGIFYDAQSIGILNNRFVDVTPFSTQLTFTDPTGPFSNPYLGVASPFPAPFPPPSNIAFPAPVLAITYDPAHQTLATPVIYNWNLAVERQIASDWLVRAAYVGSHSSHLTETVELNPAAYTPGSAPSTDARRIFQGYASIGQASQDINANYNSLQLTLQRRFSRGLTLLVNYTWSKSLDDVPNGQGVAGIASQNVSPIPWYFPGRHQLDYGPSDFDRAHRLVASYVWDLPKLSNQPPAVRYPFGNWEVTGIFTAQSGGPFTVLAGKDLSQTGLGTDRAQLVSTQVTGPGACKQTAPCVDFLSPTAFALPPPGTFGNVGKNSLRGPDYLNLDFGLFRNFPLRGERYRLQFHAEFFNSLNRVNLNNPNAGVSSAGFGSIRGANDPRIGQLALKFLF